MSEEPRPKTRWSLKGEEGRAPWYSQLIWALLFIFTGLFVLAALGFGGADWGYIEITPTSAGGCQVIIGWIDAGTAAANRVGCLRSQFPECQIVFGAFCENWLEEAQGPE